MGSAQPITRAAEGRSLTPVYPAWPEFAFDEVEAARRVLASGKVNYWTGSEGREFEKEFAAFVGTRHAVAVANGTLALEGALEAAGVGRGDDVVMTPRTFVASASCAVRLGARPVFADVDRDSQNITAETVAAALTSKTKAIIAVHLAGWPCEMDALRALADERGIVLVEDCAQAHGATHRGRSVGSFGHVAAWSFCQDKIMTTGGEGGMVTTDDDEIWQRVWSLKDHGKSYDAVYHRQHAPGFRWLHEDFGSNWRLTEMQSAIGRVQLTKLADWTAARRRHAVRLNDAFADLSALRVTVPPAHVGHAYYKYYVFVRPKALAAGWDRDRVMNSISAAGVPCLSGSCSEIYLEEAFARHGFRPPERLPVARALGETSLMFLVHPTVEDADLDRVLEATTDVVGLATR